MARVKPPTGRQASSLATEARSKPPAVWRIAALAGLIAGASIVAYLPAIHGDFIWDDEGLIANNPLVRTQKGLYDIWLTTKPVDYWPLTNTSFWIEWRLWGADTTGYHIANLALHVGCALLVWRILSMLSVPGAWLGALLFAVHPVNVESVAWIAQRKNTLSMLFFLISILCYVKDETARGVSLNPGFHAGPWYWLSLLNFLLAMLAKGSVAILPLVLLGIVWWLRGRVRMPDVLRAAPCFVVAFILTLVNIWFQRHGLDETIRDVTPIERVLGAPAAVWFYLYKAFVPLNLLFVYPQLDVNASDWRWWIPLLAAVALTALLLAQRHSRWGRPLLAAWGFFCIALLPVMGFTDVYFMKYSLVADHYQYIAIVGVAALAAAAWSCLQQPLRGSLHALSVAAAGVTVGMLILLSWQQSRLYSDADTLYEATLAKHPDCSLVRNNLGVRLYDRGQRQQAMEHYQLALKSDPGYTDAHYNLGTCLLDAGRTSEAIDHFRSALRLKPNHARAYYNLGQALVMTKQNAAAIVHLEEAARLKPSDSEILYTLGRALTDEQRFQQAIARLNQSLKLKPDNYKAELSLGVALAKSGQPARALEHYQRALALEPNCVECYANMATAYAALKQPQLAIAFAEKGLATAKTAGQPGIVQQLEAWLNSYRASIARSQNPDSEAEAAPHPAE